MFETAELGRAISKEQYEAEVPTLRTQLVRAQHKLRETCDFSVVIVIGGIDASGKGRTVNVLHEWMDPRFLETYAFDSPTDEEAERPYAWRYWRALPAKGTTAIFFGSWYTEAIYARLCKEIGRGKFEKVLSQINTFERQLTDDGTLLLKFWYHIPKKVQKKRLKKYSSDPEQSWRVTKQDWEHLKLYDRILPLCAEALQETSTGEAPWTVIEGTDRRYRELATGNHILEAITGHAQKLASLKSAAPPPAQPASTENLPTILSTLDLTKNLDQDDYDDELKRLQGRLNLLSREVRDKGISTVMVFEGWDAAGKGGAIRRMTRALDARQYKVVPIAAPTDEELARHSLWRFWRRLPRAGHVTVFDRSWYGRVLVERVEGFASEEQWRRAYKEINDFEELLTERGIAVLKFWLHIDQDEQWRRFQEREKIPYKKHKITPDDYRNREKWCQYEEAVNEMVERTSTRLAPWTLVESNDKRFARCKVLRVCCERLEQAVSEASGKK